MTTITDLSDWDKDPRLFLFTSLTAGSSHIVTATSRIETILRANRLPFQAVDTATDEKARKLWGRRAGKKKLPGLVKEGYVIADLEEIEDWNEFGELRENIGPLPPATGSTSVNTVQTSLGNLRMHDAVSQTAKPPTAAPGPRPAAATAKKTPAPSVGPVPAEGPKKVATPLVNILAAKPNAVASTTPAKPATSTAGATAGATADATAGPGVAIPASQSAQDTPDSSSGVTVQSETAIPASLPAPKAAASETTASLAEDKKETDVSPKKDKTEVSATPAEDKEEVTGSSAKDDKDVNASSVVHEKEVISSSAKHEKEVDAPSAEDKRTSVESAKQGEPESNATPSRDTEADKIAELLTAKSQSTALPADGKKDDADAAKEIKPLVAAVSSAEGQDDSVEPKDETVTSSIEDKVNGTETTHENEKPKASTPPESAADPIIAAVSSADNAGLSPPQAKTEEKKHRGSSISAASPDEIKEMEQKIAIPEEDGEDDAAAEKIETVVD